MLEFPEREHWPINTNLDKSTWLLALGHNCSLSIWNRAHPGSKRNLAKHQEARDFLVCHNSQETFSAHFGLARIKAQERAFSVSDVFISYNPRSIVPIQIPFKWSWACTQIRLFQKFPKTCRTLFIVTRVILFSKRVPSPRSPWELGDRCLKSQLSPRLQKSLFEKSKLNPENRLTE